jgi:hypothetical protein
MDERAKLAFLSGQECQKTKSEELTEAVPEALKNTLLVMAAQGVLTPAWQVCQYCNKV